MRHFAAATLVALLVVPAMALAAPSIVGNFQGWNPADPATELTVNINGVYEYATTVGDSLIEYKAVDGDAWGSDFPSANQSFNGPGGVTFYVNLGATVGTKEGDEYVFHSLNPPIVCGSFMSELGGTDWDQTDTSTTVMSDVDGDDIWEFESIIPAGSYEFKIVLNNNWSQNTAPSGNYLFGSDGVSPVLFRYHMADNTTEVFTSAAPTVVYARVDDTCPQSPDVIEVAFSKDVEETSAETTTNYSVSGGHTVVTATRDDGDNTIVYLEVTPALVEGNDFQVTVTGVTDLDSRPVDPSANTACFYLHKVVLEIDMGIYVDENAVPTSVHIQGDTYPLTWEQCLGCEAFDDGTGGDAAAGDTTYTVTQYFSMAYTCGAAAESTQVKYKYVVDCLTWEGDYNFGHYVTLDPNAASQTASVWWNDVAPVDNIACTVGVRFTVDMKSAARQGFFTPGSDTLAVMGSESPLGWTWPADPSLVLVDDGTGGDAAAADSVYTVEAVFPIGTYKFLQYKYAVNRVFECDLYPNRALTLDDVNGCVGGRVGPMLVEDLWDWCDETTAVGTTIEASWGAIKAIYRD